MKFQITMKTPDVLEDALQDCEEEARDEAETFAKQFVRYGEYLTVEFDTEAETAKVLRA